MAPCPCRYDQIGATDKQMSIVKYMNDVRFDYNC